MKSPWHAFAHIRTRSWAWTGPLERHGLCQLQNVLLVGARAGQSAHLRLESFIAGAEGNWSEVPRDDLFLVSEGLRGRIVHTRSHGLVVFLVSDLALVVVVKPRACVACSPLHLYYFLFITTLILIINRHNTIVKTYFKRTNCYIKV